MHVFNFSTTGMDSNLIVSLRRGESVTVATNHNGSDEIEEWRLICYPYFKQSTYDTVIQFCSSLGRFMKNNGDITTGCLMKNSGYRVVGMNFKSAYAHRVVLYTFCGSPPQDDDENWVYYSCDHVSGCRDDNRIQNLRWATFAEQQANIGVKRFDTLKPGEERQKRTSSSNLKHAVKRIKRGEPKSKLVYTEYASSWSSVEEVAQNNGCLPSTVMNYIYQHYNPIHAVTICEKLNLDTSSIEHAYTVMTANKIVRTSDKSIKASEFTQDIFDALGPNCTNCVLANKLLSKLYIFFCT